MIGIVFGMLQDVIVKMILFVKFLKVKYIFIKLINLCILEVFFKFNIDVQPPVTTPAPGYCPGADWLTYGTNCYRIERTTRSYGEAKLDCSFKGLVSIIFKNRI
jgi:hypothetical protein